MKSFGSAIKVTAAFCMTATMLLSSSEHVLATTSNTVSISMIGKYDSADTAAIRSVDTENKQIRLRNHTTGKTYTLNYDNTSMMFDARGVVLSAQMLEPGQIVDVTFLKSSKHITTLNVSKDAWVIDSTKDHELVRNDGTARIKDEIYHIDAKTLVMADGDLAIAENVLSTDKIKVSGIGKDIYSVIVTSGHGYVSLSSDTVDDQSLVGAWLELDNEVIHKISPNMLLSAPEGQYNLQIIGNGANFQSEVSISRNQETVVDTSDVTIERPKEGMVTFEIIPESAEVFVDGQRMLVGTPQGVQYGYHNLKIMADGYITQNRYLKVGTANSIISIELEKESESDESSKSLSVNNATVHNASEKSSLAVKNANASELISKHASASTTASTVSENSSSDSSGNKIIEGYYIYFDEPEFAELYFDGNYIGIIPTKVQKISGNHEVILKRDGYQTKSYRLKIDTAKDNCIYEFPDMIKEEDDKGSSSTSASSAASSSSSSDSSKSASSEASKEASKDASKDSSKDSSKEASTAAPSSASTVAPSETPTDSTTSSPSSDSTIKPSEDATKEAPSHSTEQNTSSSPTETTQNSGEEAHNSESSDTTNSTSSQEEPSDAASAASGEN